MFNSNTFKFLSVSLLMCPMFSFAMEVMDSFGAHGIAEKRIVSDFQIYQLLLAAKNEHQLDFPNELIQIITMNACSITELRHEKEIKAIEEQQMAALHNLCNAVAKRVVDQGYIVDFM